VGARRNARAVKRLVRSALVAAVVALFAASSVSVSGATRESPSAIPAATYNLKSYPLASFVWFPGSPHTGQPVSLVSTSKDATSPITNYAWDVADNGPFGPFEAGGPATTTTFATPASHQVRLRVTAADHLSSVAVETIQMSTPPPGVLLPFPLVRIVGTVFRSGVKLRLLAVKAPAQAQIAVGCRGGACPASSTRRLAASRGGRALWTRFRRFERYLPARMILEIRVSRGGEVGAYTRFVIRRRRLPIRADSCLDPAGTKPIVCPT
jgi:PKD domain